MPHCRDAYEAGVSNNSALEAQAGSWMRHRGGLPAITLSKAVGWQQFRLLPTLGRGVDYTHLLIQLLPVLQLLLLPGLVLGECLQDRGSQPQNVMLTEDGPSTTWTDPTSYLQLSFQELQLV